MRRLTIPLDATRFNQQPARHFACSIHLKTEKGLQAVLCPSHDVSIRRINAHEAIIELEASGAFLARDLTLLYSIDDAPMGAVLASYRRPGRRGYFVLSIDAAFAKEKQAHAPRDVVVAIDTSNSSGRDGVDAAAAAVARAVEGLKKDDRYALVAFSTESRLVADFQHPGEDTSRQVRALFRNQPVYGRTRLDLAVAGAADVATRGRPGAGVILLTDGRESEPGGDAALVAKNVAANGHRVGFCALGGAADTLRLDALGSKGRGDSAYARHTLADSVKYLLETTRQVPLTDVTVRIDGVSDLYPREIRVVNPGDSIRVAGRYTRTGDVRVRVAGTVGGERVARTFKLNLRARGGDPAVARMWAARRVGDLLDDARRHSDPDRHKREILSLGRKFGIVTPHTSLLVLEDADQKRFLRGMARRPLLSSDGGVLIPRRAGRTREAVSEAELAARIRKLQRAGNGAVNPFADLLGSNRLKVRRVGDRTFYRGADGTWRDSDLVDNEPAEPRVVRFLSPEWEALAANHADVMALGRRVLFQSGEEYIRIEEE